MAAFLGSGTAFLQRNYEPTYDRLDLSEDEEDELRMSSDSFNGTQTLDEVGYTIAPYGSFILGEKKEKVEAVFKKNKLPKGATLPKLGPNECSICMMDVETDSIVETDCGHRYCSDCMSYYLHLQSGDIKNLEHTLSSLEKTPQGVALRVSHVCGIACPHPTCHSVMEGPTIFKFADSATWQRFEHLCLSILLEKLARTKQVVPCPQECGGVLQGCVCSNEDCRIRTAAMAEKERVRLFKAWRVAQMKSMELLRKWATGWARQCPKCEFLIEKNGGCDHMYCTQCKTHFSWLASSSHF